MTPIITEILISVIAGLILYFMFGIGKNNRFSSRFSSTQSIKILPPSLGGVDHLNLDNIATLQLHVPYDTSRITLMLNKMPVIELSPQISKGIKVESFLLISHEGARFYTFSTTDSTQKIPVAGRIFVVSLRKISKMDIWDAPSAIEFEFGISEE